MKNILSTICLIFVLAFLGFAQSKISAQCKNVRGVSQGVYLESSGDISINPCPNGQLKINTLYNAPFITGRNYTSLTDFQNAPLYTVNTFNGILNTDETTFRLGGNKSYFEQFQSSTGVLNYAALETNETAPVAGGFARIMLLSDTTHSYLYNQAQRFIFNRTDGWQLHNFFGNGKWTVRVQLPSISALPNEDTARFQAGNLTDFTAFIDLLNETPSQQSHFIARAQKIRLDVSAPVDTGQPCEKGEIGYDTNFLYLCADENTWRKVPLDAI